MQEGGEEGLKLSILQYIYCIGMSMKRSRCWGRGGEGRRRARRRGGGVEAIYSPIYLLYRDVHEAFQVLRERRRRKKKSKSKKEAEEKEKKESGSDSGEEVGLVHQEGRIASSIGRVIFFWKIDFRNPYSENIGQIKHVLAEEIFFLDQPIPVQMGIKFRFFEIPPY